MGKRYLAIGGETWSLNIFSTCFQPAGRHDGNLFFQNSTSMCPLLCLQQVFIQLGKSFTENISWGKFNPLVLYFHLNCLPFSFRVWCSDPSLQAKARASNPETLWDNFDFSDISFVFFFKFIFYFIGILGYILWKTKDRCKPSNREVWALYLTLPQPQCA